MKEIYILGIETSCDETSASIVKNGTEVLSLVINSQIEEHKKYGGVVPDLASRMHVEAISTVVEKAILESGIKKEDIDAVAYTKGPGLIGALLVGVSFAKAYAYALKIPFIPVHHIEGHIAANYISHPELKPPYLALVISGGHTHLIHIKDYTNYEIIGKTKDDAVGEAFDKVGRVIGLSYPGGPKIDKLAYDGKDNISLPTPKVDGLNFSFSGLKTHVINYAHNKEQKGEEISKEDLSKSFTDKVIEILLDKTLKASKMLGIKKIAISGGVSANSHIRREFLNLKDKGYDIFFPEFIYCTDNAAMVAAQGYFEFLENARGKLSDDAVPNLKIGEWRN